MTTRVTQGKTLSVRIPGPLADALARRAAQEGNPVSSVTRRLLSEQLSREAMVDRRIRGDGDASKFEEAPR